MKQAGRVLLAVLLPPAIILAEQGDSLAGPIVALAVALLLWRLGRGGPVAWALPLLVAALAGASLLFGSAVPLRFYPVAVNVGLCALFGLSLAFPPSAIERIARMREPQLPPRGVRYTRQVTWVWVAFFLVNGSVALWTAVWGTDAQWALYNGAIAYGLAGALFALEYLVRRSLRCALRPAADDAALTAGRGGEGG